MEMFLLGPTHSPSGFERGNAIIHDDTFVQATIAINETIFYVATANYQLESEDWLVTTNIPGSPTDLTVDSVNHHFTFELPVADGDLVALTTTSSVGVYADAALPGPDDSISATVHLTTSALAWALATPLGESPLPSDFGDRDVDAADYQTWQSNFGAEMGASGPEGDGNLDGAINAADYIVWRKSFEQSGSGNSLLARRLIVPEPGTANLLLYFSVAMSCGRRRTIGGS